MIFLMLATLCSEKEMVIVVSPLILFKGTILESVQLQPETAVGCVLTHISSV